MVRGGPAGGTWETPAAGRNLGGNLVPLSFPGTFTHPVVGSGWKWYIVGQSGRKWGKTGRDKSPLGPPWVVLRTHRRLGFIHQIYVGTLLDKPPDKPRPHSVLLTYYAYVFSVHPGERAFPLGQPSGSPGRQSFSEVAGQGDRSMFPYPGDLGRRGGHWLQ